MAKKDKITTYPVGSIVRIKQWDRKPDNWNSDMYRKLSGQSARVSHVASGRSPTSYRYTLSDWSWNWRHCDLILIKLAKLEPNQAFKIRKHGH